MRLVPLPFHTIMSDRQAQAPEVTLLTVNILLFLIPALKMQASAALGSVGGGGAKKDNTDLKLQ